MNNDLAESINTILAGFKRELCEFNKTVELLDSLFQRQTPDQQKSFFDLLQARFLSEEYSHLRPVRSAHEVIIRVWAGFGPADRLPSIIFALLRYDDREGMQAWAVKIAPEFGYSLLTNRTRFSRVALDLIAAQCALLTYERSTEITGTQFPTSLVEAASRLQKIVDKINFERFAETLEKPLPSVSSGETPANSSLPDLKLEILRVVAQSPRSTNKYNLLGRPPAKGELELARGMDMDAAERNLAYVAFDDLRRSDYIRPTYTDLVSPEDWVVATETGREALRTGAFDSLDQALRMIAPHLLSLRRGAWAALHSGTPHSLEQAAHSARELIDQVMKIGAPDEEVKARPDYVADPASSSGVTRRMRLRFLVAKFGGDLSESDLKVAEGASDFVLAIAGKVMALAHSRTAPDPNEVRDVIVSAEIALNSIFRSVRRVK